MRLIDADALKRAIGCADVVKWGNKDSEQQHRSYSTMMMYEIADCIDDAPTIEAETVRHGRWVPWKGRYKTIPQCSECGHTTRPDGYPYCPNYGAKMDAKEETNK